MTLLSGWIFLDSFIAAYNFSSIQAAMARISLALGFYGGIAVLGRFYKLLFMPKTKNRTLEEIALNFEKLTTVIVKLNIRNRIGTSKDLIRLRFRKVATEIQTVR